MNTAGNRGHRSGITVLWCCALAACLGAGAAEVVRIEPAPPLGALHVSPVEVIFPSTVGEVRFSVTRSSVPVPASEIKAEIAGGYGWMFEILKSAGEPGQVVLRARPGNTERGTYDLVFRVGKEERRARVIVTLEHEMAGLPPGTSSGGYTVVSKALPPYYYEGQVLDLDFAELRSDTWYSWRVNDREVLEGIGESRLRHVLDQPGELRVRLEARRGQGTPAIPWSGASTVRTYPAQETTVAVGTTLTCEGPTGYGDYEWRLGGASVGTGTRYSHRFDQPGVYKVECVARMPQGGTRAGYYRCEWRVTVR
ncbi:MAG TPA: hypothetical protein PKI11_04170 [Candidatus Hydrogenedentes bacterium]|nr:hypothetical protein [Candidatus Hydrogenedentota bacterium]HNT87222.1 hypothetical protein [Candidatus Hydrogenedentota bacterium]